MTKKFIHSDKKVNGVNLKSEFLIPDIFDNKNRLIGIKSRKVYEFGIVVFTGVDLDEEKILNKIPDLQSINDSQKKIIKATFKDYLSQVRDFKIGKTVKFDNNSKLLIEDKSND